MNHFVLPVLRVHAYVCACVCYRQAQLHVYALNKCRIAHSYLYGARGASLQARCQAVPLAKQHLNTTELIRRYKFGVPTRINSDSITTNRKRHLGLPWGAAGALDTL